MEHRRAVYKGWLLPDSSCSPFSVLIVGKFFHENKEADRVLSVPPATDPDVHPAQKLRSFLLDNAFGYPFFLPSCRCQFLSFSSSSSCFHVERSFSRSYVCESVRFVYHAKDSTPVGPAEKCTADRREPGE